MASNIFPIAGLKYQINSNSTQKNSRFLRRQDETWLPTGDFLVHKVCGRVFGTWWFMHEMVVLVRFQIDLIGSQNFWLEDQSNRLKNALKRPFHA